MSASARKGFLHHACGDGERLRPPLHSPGYAEAIARVIVLTEPLRFFASCGVILYSASNLLVRSEDFEFQLRACAKSGGSTIYIHKRLSKMDADTVHSRDRRLFAATAVFSMLFAGFAAISVEAREVARYFTKGEWIEFGYDDTEIMLKGYTPPVTDASCFVEETSPFPGWQRLRLAAGSARESHVVASMRAEGHFVSPLLDHPEHGPALVHEAVLNVSVPFRDWERHFEVLVDTIENAVSVRVLSSPLGTESETFEYFREALAPFPVEPPRHPYDGIVPPPLPDELRPPINEDGFVVFAFSVENTCGFELFDHIEELSAFEWIDGANPALFMRMRGGMLVGMSRSGFGWGRDDSNRVWIWTPPPAAPQDVRYRMGEGWTWSGDAAAETGWHWNFARGAWMENRWPRPAEYD